ncbi:uncharacterized protein LOC126821031 isoform X1 [Patella vulgata]|uniref:uncharacterized protein LOC126821031 isoform X1 n=1 Tax=Patella vulgata TaxID=6465 RepID=UPI0024A8D166|nr:uncharacterized protein LOC126821031 isoform X1 [Patella vulgata]
MSTGRLSILFSLLTITTFIDVDAKIVARATCDDDMYFYADGVLMTNHSDWSNPTQIDLPDNTTVLGVHCVDTGGIAGIYVTYTLNKFYKTDTSWKCSAKFEQNWNTPGFEDGNWDAASIAHESIRKRTDWIWTSGYRGEDTDVYCRKKIQDQPIIRTITSDAVDKILIDENASVTINCLVESIPAARVSWSRSQQGGQLYSGSQYTIPKASCQHTDNYTCTASNNIGQPVSKTIPLVVRCTPVVMTTQTIVVVTKDVIVVPRGETAVKEAVKEAVDDKMSKEDTLKEAVDDKPCKDTVKEAVDDKMSKEGIVKESVDDKLGVGIAIGVSIGLVVSGVLSVIIWGIRKRRDAIMSNDGHGVNDTVSSQSRDNTTRHCNSPVDTGDSVEYVNTIYTPTSSDYEGLDELTMDHRPNIYLPLSNKRQGR